MRATGIASDARFVLLCGCPRSGTTLLAQHVGRALGIAMPVETHFVPHFRRYLALWGDIAEAERQRLLLEAIEAYTRIWVYRGIRSANPVGHAEISLLPELEQMQPVTGGFPRLLESVYRQYAARFRMPHFGDKSAPFEPEDLSLYEASVDGLRVVHIVRDGRDVHLSWSAFWFGPRSLAETAWIWRRHVERHRAWGRRNPQRYLEIRYEDFVADPNAVLATIAAFVGVEPRADSATDPLGSVIGQEHTHRKLAERVDQANAQKWQRAMPASDQALFEYIAADALTESGYAVAGSRPRGRQRILLPLRYAWGMTRRYLSPTYYLRRGRALMPLIFRFMQLVGIRPGRVAESMTSRTQAAH